VLPNGHVRRPALLARLTAGAESSLTLVVAPAGYGKTTLLAEWSGLQERPVVWVSLTGRERDANAVATSIAHTLEKSGWVDSGEPAVRRARSAGVTGLNRLMRFLTATGRRFVIVLDDAHRVPPAALRAVGKILLDQPSTGVQILVAARGEPSLGIGRLRASRRLVELGPGDLAMSPAEAASLLRRAGLGVDFAEVQALVSRTEGWPVGLYLAALSLRGDEVSDEQLQAFGGDDRMISDYLHEEVLASLSPRLRRFLVRTSVLDELSGPACDAVLQQSGSGDILARLARGQTMLYGVDSHQQRFRCHSLLRTMLRAELRHREPDLESDLHARASRWRARQGDLQGALDHAGASGDLILTGELLWDCLPGYLASGQMKTIARWVDGFTAQQIASSPALGVAAGLTSLVSGHGERARQCAALVAPGGPRGLSDAEDGLPQPGPVSEAALLEAAMGRGGPKIMAARARAVYEREPTYSAWRPLCCWLWGVAEQLAGNVSAARERLQEGVELSASEAPMFGALCLTQLALLAIDADDWDLGGELAESAVSLVTSPALERYPLAALVFATAAATRARQARNDEAKRDLRRASDLLDQLEDGLPWYVAETRLTLARATIALADTVSARSLLAETSRLTRHAPQTPMFQRWLDESWAQIDNLAETALAGPSTLTIAELRILRFLPSHRSFREIAERLHVSVNTVKTQAHAIYRKLDVTSRSEAVGRAAEAGLLGS
jgi:LuxR family maltose regulon positive regulatory protein